LKLSDDLHLNEIDCVRLLVTANQEVNLGCYCLSQLFIFWHYCLSSVLFYLMLLYSVNLNFTSKKNVVFFFFFSFFLVEFNRTRAIGNFTPCSGTLVY
jgi:hypothetical protein